MVMYVYVQYINLSIGEICWNFMIKITVKRPKFGIGPYVRHPLYELLKNHIFAWAEVSDLVQRGEKLYIFFLRVWIIFKKMESYDVW